MEKIPNDFCRCHDDTCDFKDKCLRYINRDNGGSFTPHCSSLFVFDDVSLPMKKKLMLFFIYQNEC